jgi:site-specific DNA-methyltransferase (adenine-specific)
LRETPRTCPVFELDRTLEFVSGILYCGDNVEVLTEYVPSESVNLVYLDPPFNSRRTFNIVYKGSQAQETAFKDYWSWEEAAGTYARLIDSPQIPRRLRSTLRSLHDLLVDDDSDLLAYLAMMSPRLVALHRVLKPTGSLYLHCDPTASHYLKVLLDSIFGAARFLNEVVWQRTNVHSDAKRWSPVSDTLLFYAKGDGVTWNPTYLPHSAEYVSSKYRHVDADGRRYRLDNMTSPNPRPNMTYEWKGHAPPPNGWRFSRETMQKLDADGRIWYPDSKSKRPQFKRYLDEMQGTLLGNVWTDIDPINSQAAERLGYPTQKPLPLLERIVKASSNPGDLVLDPFCGCGTTIEACERLGRRWIGIDIARKAVEVIEGRFAKLELVPPTVVWHPVDVAAASALAQRSGQQFEEWVLRRIRAARQRKRDRGIDGEAFFRETDGRTWHALVSVKGGTMNPAMVRDLRGTLERERADIGVLVSMLEPSKEMKLEAARAGHLQISDADGPIPRLQLVTIEQIFAGRPAIRCLGRNETQMPRASVPQGKGEQLALKLDTRTRSTPPPPAKTKIKPKQIPGIPKLPTETGAVAEGGKRPSTKPPSRR